MSMIQGIINAASAWLFKGVNDEYVSIRHASPKESAVKEIPQSLRERDIPDFGKDQERMLQMAVKNFHNEELQVKWLKTMHHLRFGTGKGWLAEKSIRRRRSSSLVLRPEGFGVLHKGMVVLEDSDRYQMGQIDHARIEKLFEEMSKPVPVTTKGGLTLVK